MVNLLYGLVQVLKQPLKLFFPVKIYGKEKVDKQEKLILALNHQSGWDPILWTIWTKKHTRFMYKSTFDKNWFLRAAFNTLEYVSVDRGTVDLGAIKEAMQILNGDKLFGVFPEGTRNKEVDCLQDFKVGTAMIAIKTRSPIRPVYIFDRAKAFHKNYMLVGEKFTLEQFYGKRLTRQVLEEATEIIKQNMEQIRVELNAVLAEKGVKRRKRTKKEIREREAFIEARKQRLEGSQTSGDEQEGNF